MISDNNLFALRIVDESMTHPQFRDLRDSRFHREERSLMNHLYWRMGPNENFMRDFQGAGFHSRVFELGCFAYLEAAGFTFDHSNIKPDFLVSRDGIGLAIEATTANPSTGQGTDISVVQMQDLSTEEVCQKVANEFPRRMMGILQRKVDQKYHELPQCAGKPLILMVAPFFEPGSVFYTDEALVEPLYGIDGRVEKPFFQNQDAAPISAILYCNGFTVARFFRLASRFDELSDVVATRTGTCYIRHTESQHSVAEFEYRVGHQHAPDETWSQGVTIFENPYAATPLPKHVMHSTSVLTVRGGQLVREISDFHPVLSFMTVGVSASERTENMVDTP